MSLWINCTNILQVFFQHSPLYTAFCHTILNKLVLKFQCTYMTVKQKSEHTLQGRKNYRHNLCIAAS